MALSPSERLARKLVVAGALSAALGAAVAGTVSPTVGGLILLAGWLVLAAAIHRFGRADGFD